MLRHMRHPRPVRIQRIETPQRIVAMAAGHLSHRTKRRSTLIRRQRIERRLVKLETTHRDDNSRCRRRCCNKSMYLLASPSVNAGGTCDPVSIANHLIIPYCFFVAGPFGHPIQLTATPTKTACAAAQRTRRAEHSRQNSSLFADLASIHPATRNDGIAPSTRTKRS